MYDYDNECEFPFIEEECEPVDIRGTEGDFDGNYTQEEYDYSDYMESEDFSEEG